MAGFLGRRLVSALLTLLFAANLMAATAALAGTDPAPLEKISTVQSDPAEAGPAENADAIVEGIGVKWREAAPAVTVGRVPTATARRRLFSANPTGPPAFRLV